MHIWASTIHQDGEMKLGIIRLRDHHADEENGLLARTLFELSRNPESYSDSFDSLTHTLTALSNGLPGHYPITARAIDDSELPPEDASRGSRETNRNNWYDDGNRIQSH